MTEINQFEENPNVASVSESLIQYSAEVKIKIKVVRENMKGRLAKAKARIKYLTAENELLKKLEKLEGQAKRTN